MNDDVMRLSDLVPEYARYYKVSLQDAAYALHEIFVELDAHHHSRQPYKAIPDQVVWVGEWAVLRARPRCISYIFLCSLSILMT